MYSLSQDNEPFTNAILRHPTAIQAIVGAVETDHGAVEEQLSKRVSKGKKKEINGDAAEHLPDGRALLARVSLAGE